MVYGYKGFDHDMTCRGFKYEVGQTYEMEGRIEPCERGFHFCQNMADVFSYYNEKGCRYAEVEALGNVIDHKDMSVTDKLRIIQEITRAEALEIMYAAAGLAGEPVPFPTEEVIAARENGTLHEFLPGGTEFPVRFSNGERNVLVVGRDRNHTYLITKYTLWLNRILWTGNTQSKTVGSPVRCESMYKRYTPCSRKT